MFKSIGKLGWFLMLSIIVSSCATKDQVVYFDDVSKILKDRENLLEYEPKIEAK